MKVLLISFYFPPYNAIGAVRVGKLAKLLLKEGHDVKVLTAKNAGLPKTLETEIPEINIIRTDWFNINSIPISLIKWNKNINNNDITINPIVKKLEGIYRTLFNFPDGQIGWYLPAVKEGKKIVSEWQPDLVYASAMPFTSLCIASKLARKTNIPWIAEFRDLWAYSPYNDSPSWRNWLEKRYESFILNDVKKIVTVSEPLAEKLRNTYFKPADVILNGYDPDDYTDCPENTSSTSPLVISYTGIVYHGRRDPSLLFQAIKELGWGKKDILVKFYGRKLGVVKQLASFHSVENCIEIYDSVSYKESIKLQQTSDILLLLLWDNPGERGVYTGKLFEYLGARRPILCLGLEDGVAANLLRSRNSGFICNSLESLVTQLKLWREIKKDTGIKFLPKVNSFDLTRERQFSKINTYVEEICSKPVSNVPLRILIIIGQLDIGGAETHLLKILPELKRKNIEPVVFPLKNGGKLEKEFEKKGIRILKNKTNINSKLRLVSSVFSLCRVMRNEKINIVHFFLPEAYLIGTFCSVVTPTTLRVMSRRSLNLYQDKYPYLKYVEKLFHNYMDAVLGNSQAVVDELLNEGVKINKLGLIYNGIELPNTNYNESIEGLREKLNLPKKSLIIIVVANLIPYKGHADLFTAIGKIHELLEDDWCLICAGRDDGYSKSLIEIAHHYNILEHVKFVGEIRNVNQYLFVSDIGVLPSHQEGFSNSLIEGMANELPMIATSVGGNEEAIEDGKSGIIVPPHSPGILGEKILALSNNKKLRLEIGEAARKRVSELYTLERCVSKYEKLYRSLCKNKFNTPVELSWK